MNGNHQTIGYKRVSTVEQNTSRQLADFEFDKVFEDKCSGKNIGGRPALLEMIDYVRDGDEVYIHSLDRLGRSLKDLLELIEIMNGKGVTIHFVKEGMVISPNGEQSSMSKLILGIMGSICEFERSLILERQREGIRECQKRGGYKGRKPISKDKLEQVEKYIADGKGIIESCNLVGISRSCFYKNCMV